MVLYRVLKANGWILHMEQERIFYLGNYDLESYWGQYW